MQKPLPKTKPTLGFSEKELRAKHDNMYKIREGIKRLPRGRYLKDQEMRELCNVPPNVWRSYAENQAFEKNKIKLSGESRPYWGNSVDIERLKSDLCVN